MEWRRTMKRHLNWLVGLPDRVILMRCSVLVFIWKKVFLAKQNRKRLSLGIQRRLKRMIMMRFLLWDAAIKKESERQKTGIRHSNGSAKERRRKSPVVWQSWAWLMKMAMAWKKIRKRLWNIWWKLLNRTMVMPSLRWETIISLVAVPVWKTIKRLWNGMRRLWPTKFQWQCCVWVSITCMIMTVWTNRKRLLPISRKLPNTSGIAKDWVSVMKWVSEWKIMKRKLLNIIRWLRIMEIRRVCIVPDFAITTE